MNECTWRTQGWHLHQACDEGFSSASSETPWFRNNNANNNATNTNWRDISSQKKGANDTMFVYKKKKKLEDDYKQNKQADAAAVFKKQGMKFCAGNACGLWLPLAQFASNANTDDGSDIYCIGCNQTKRHECSTRRTESRKCTTNTEARDALESFCERELETGATTVKYNVESRAMKKITDALRVEQETRGDTGILTSRSIYAKLFVGGRLCCEYTGRSMTVSCFADHHSLQLVRDGRKLDVECDHCFLAPTNNLKLWNFASTGDSFLKHRSTHVCKSETSE